MRPLVRRAADALCRRVGRPLRSQYLPTLFHGHWLWLARDSWESVELLYEPHVAAVLLQHLPRGGVFVDVGAHFGLWSLYASRLSGETGRVIACEPSEAFEMLEKNTQRIAHVERVKSAVGDRDAAMVFHGQGRATSGSLVRGVTEINQHHSPDVPIKPFSVTMRSLDSLSTNGGWDPDLIKVDVEGYECHVLNGATAVMERSSPTWIIEIHPPQLRECGATDQDCLNALERRGYAVRIIDHNQNSVYTIVACRPVSGRRDLAKNRVDHSKSGPAR